MIFTVVVAVISFAAGAVWGMFHTSSEALRLWEAGYQEGYWDGAEAVVPEDDEEAASAEVNP